LWLLALLGAIGLAAYRPAMRTWALRRSEARFLVGDPAGALQVLEANRPWLPRDAELTLQSARALRKLARPEEARRELEQARRLGTPHARVDREELLLLAQNGWLAESESALPRLLSDLRYDARDVTEAYAEGYRLHFRLEEASALLEAWRQDYPDDPRPHLMLGVMRQTVTDWPAAVQEFRAALARGAEWPPTRLRLGQCLLENNDVAAAEAELRRFVSAHPENSEGRLYWAQTLEQLGRPEDARREFQTCLQRDPREFAAAVAVARLDVAAGRAAEAVARLSSLLADWPEDAEALHVYAQA
jgi:predicted Zn-dependent protease